MKKPIIQVIEHQSQTKILNHQSKATHKRLRD